MADVNLRKVRKAFGAVEIIKGVDLDIGDGEFCVFVGPSGCGKSTLLRMIAGLEDITSGELRIGGRDMSDTPSSQRGVAMVFQSYALYPHMTVRDNIGFGLRMTGHAKSQIEARTRHAADMLQLGALLDRKPSQLSGGQRQRVAIGRAIVREPGVFLFDEPLSNLDAALRVQMRIEIGKLHQSLATTMIYVTHDQIEAMTMADRIVVLQGGVVQQYDTPEAVYERPANQFVAGFIGSPTMNFFPTDVDGGAAANPFAGAISASLDARTSGSIIGIRPEHFELAPADAGGVAIEIKLVEPLGSDTLIHFDVGGTAAIARLDPALKPKVGERLHLRPREGKTHLFDRTSGRVLS